MVFICERRGITETDKRKQRAPKKIFRDAENFVPAKKPFKPGRIVASRYNQPPVKSSIGKSVNYTDCKNRSLPKHEDDEKFCDKKRASLAAKSRRNPVGHNEEKNKWEIPNVIFELKGLVEEYLISISRMLDLLSKIRTLQSVADSPRDSGRAKKVLELVEKKSIFGAADEEEGEGSASQALDFAEDQDQVSQE
ncbi:hypothetical protein RJ641_030702 [Dillenia turbinata]|uniref:Uncharacterized protein n=1 Tax=Dillenia turbinata TaxID=194707 RepID=A0AAN8W4H2_9MAGN